MKYHYAAQFGLPEDQIKFFDELTETQKKDVAWYFNLVNPGSYIYAVKRDGSLVAKREKRNMLYENSKDFE